MRYLRCSTPTVLDIREIITLGLTTKTNSTTSIGHKGSGLKFSLAFIHRLGGYMEARTATYHLRSEIAKTIVRGNEHELIVLRDPTTQQTIEAGITTHAGADTWQEPWYILRELLQNVIDEKGTYEIVETDEVPVPNGEGTTIQIPLVDKLEEAWSQKDTWFQPRYRFIVDKGHPSVKGLYFHGFRIYEGKNWRYSYDVTPFLQRSQLSEDRALKNGDLYSVFFKLAEIVQFNDFGPEIYNAAYEEILAPDIEHLYDGVWNIITPSCKAWGGPGGFSLESLEAAFRRRNGEHAAFHTQNLSPEDPSIYYAKTVGFTPVQVPYRVGNILQSFGSLTPLHKCLPTLQNRLRKINNTDVTRKGKLKLAMRLVKKLQPEGTKVIIVEKILATDNMECGAIADPTRNQILILENLLDLDIDEIAKALIEEYAHIITGGGDQSMEMQQGLIDMLYQVLVKNKRVSVEQPIITKAA